MFLRAPSQTFNDLQEATEWCADVWKELSFSARDVIVERGTLTAGVADAFAFAWQNPTDSSILVYKIFIDVTTAGGTATAVLNVGSAASATTTSDNLIDGADLNAIAVYDNIDDQGTNGESKQKLDENGGTTDWVTGQILVEAAASLVGKYYIHYTVI